MPGAADEIRPGLRSRAGWGHTAGCAGGSRGPDGAIATGAPLPSRMGQQMSRSHAPSELDHAFETIEEMISAASLEEIPDLFGRLSRLQTLVALRAGALGRANDGQPAAQGERLLAAPEVARLLAVSKWMAREMMRHELPSVPFGRRCVRVKLSDVLELVRRRTEYPVPISRRSSGRRER